MRSTGYTARSLASIYPAVVISYSARPRQDRGKVTSLQQQLEGKQTETQPDRDQLGWEGEPWKGNVTKWYVDREIYREQTRYSDDIPRLEARD